MKDNLVLIYTTISNNKAACHMVNILLQEKLIICANIFHNVTSIYYWENTIKNNKEYIIIMKTSKHLYEKALQKIQNIHPYEIPLITIINPYTTNNKFIDWMNYHLTN
ncbi:divalent-cation tolerance protein CutA [Neoehrlichia mikurensis]|uniref:Divalent-cation tolerance protein CutA n=1 Tax=Neoehrlichia mikurensis TaxID=89586 RepID=A0A9Q9BRZ6_9RICK|nr:divalent-cation tolerance protein CutA [Neoehrlichia mikurensis]QXK92048.1 divalent-cation tolerance protein CutA [Neoehrlichia mikurensis]QXK92505.1 divalent-cation tolerance protein CutA [Neoehrlichia mikurensis]QXK93741.1 divalent-cation tolerance protein CutA [Neoehrlichia mikurensis]UTO55287.1 divalent-cation tolerance protein CutA [Neoehrlichia mikurensis]UTO56207.1 divalent-cation tolerance protein CutA [Neoehrlichia mikurensis]